MAVRPVLSHPIQSFTFRQYGSLGPSGCTPRTPAMSHECNPLELRFNPGCQVVHESPTLAINQKAKAMREQGRSITHFGFGQSPFPAPSVFTDALIKNADNNHYLPTFGLPQLREAIAGYFSSIFGYRASGEQIVVGPGSKELLFDLLFMLEGEVFVPSGSWVSYIPQAQMLNKPLRILDTSFENGFCLQPDKLERECKRSSSKLKILILNSPNNPTGQVYDETTLLGLADVCRKNNVLVISDEIYALIDYKESDIYPSLAYYYPEGTIVTSGVSKLFSAGGYRLGFALVPEHMGPLLDVWKGVVSETYSCVSSPVQFAALAVYENPSLLKEYIRDTVAIHKFASMYLYERFLEMGIECKKPQGGFYLMPVFNKFAEQFDKYTNGTFFKSLTDPSTLMCEMILEEAGVVMLPGRDFYVKKDFLAARVASVDYDGDVVLSFVKNGGTLSMSNIEKLMPSLVHGCNRLESFLSKVKKCY